MITKTCTNCNKEFSAKRRDAKFCSSTCRSEYWLKNKEEKLAELDFQKQVKGLVSENGKSTSPVNKKVKLTREYLDASGKYFKKCADMRALDHRIKLLEEELYSQINGLKTPYTIIGTGAGAYIGYTRTENRLISPNKRLNRTIFGGIGGLITGMIIDSATKESREKQTQDEIKRIKQGIEKINVSKTLLRKEIDTLNEAMNSMEKFTVVEEKINVNRTHNTDSKGVTNDHPVSGNNTGNVSKHQLKPLLKATGSKTGGKIIRSTELAGIEYHALDFTGKWLELFGQPSVNFHCAVHGMAGEGKSTFCIQFAHYLASDFGPVVYVSGEEGFSKTMKDKFVNNNAVSDDLAIADLRNYKELVDEIKPNTYNFIFIDSLDNMHIGAQELKELRKLYSASALITISQSTKDGKIRGSYEIVHDADIAVSVSQGVATTVKNRFLEKGRILKIF